MSAKRAALLKRRLPAGRPLVVVALLIFAGASLLRAFSFGGGAQDEGLLLVYPHLIVQGEVPNRDFEHLYGPADVGVLAGVYSTVGSGVTAERTVGLIYRFLLVVSIFGLAGRNRWEIGLLAGVISVIFLAQSSLSAYAWFGAVATSALSLWILTAAQTDTSRPSQKTHVACTFAGLLAGISLLFRPDLVVAVLPSSLLLIRFSFSRITWTLGLIAGLSPYLLLILLVSPEPLFRSLVLDPLTIEKGRSLPLPPLNSVEGQILYSLLIAALMSCAIGAYLFFFDRKCKRSAALLPLAVFSLGLLPDAIQRADSIHVTRVAAVILALLPVFLERSFIRTTKRGGGADCPMLLLCSALAA
jgi:hypothetical protein